MTPTQEWLTEQVDNLVKSRFYGKVTLSFEAGNITTVKKEEHIIVPEILKKPGNWRQKIK